MSEQTGEKYVMRPTQDEAAYTPDYQGEGGRCASCRFFTAQRMEEYQSGAYCHLIDNWPADILPTGRCNRWEAVPEVGMEIQPMPVVIVEPEVKEKQDKVEAVERKGMFARMKAALEQVIHKEVTFSAFKSTGNHWFTVWSNNFEDREGEIFTAKALDRYTARVDMGVVPLPELWVWHAGKETRIGQAEWVARHGHFLVAAGQFDDAPRALKAKAYYQKHAKKTAISHGFTYPKTAFDGKHYHDFNTFEITLLPRGAEANSYTALEKVKEMPLTPEKKKYLAEVFGEDEATKVLNEWDERGKMLEELDVQFKDFVATDEEAAPASKEAVESVETDLKDFFLDIMADSAHVVKVAEAQAKAFKALQDSVATTIAEQNKEIATLKEQLDARPRIASQDDKTKLNTNNAKEKTIFDSVTAQVPEDLGIFAPPKPATSLGA